MNLLAINPLALKIAAGAALVLFLSLGSFGAFQYLRAERNEIEAGSLRNERDALSNNLATARAERTAASTSADQWRVLHGKVSEQLRQDRAELDRMRTENAAALADAQARAADADATLRAWLERYQRPAESAACAAFLNTKLRDVCPNLAD